MVAGQGKGSKASKGAKGSKAKGSKAKGSNGKGSNGKGSKGKGSKGKGSKSYKANGDAMNVDINPRSPDAPKVTRTRDARPAPPPGTPPRRDDAGNPSKAPPAPRPVPGRDNPRDSKPMDKRVDRPVDRGVDRGGDALDNLVINRGDRPVPTRPNQSDRDEAGPMYDSYMDPDMDSDMYDTTDDGVWRIELTGQDLFIAALVLLNVVMITSICCMCSGKKAVAKKGPAVYGVDSNEEMEQMVV